MRASQIGMQKTAAGGAPPPPPPGLTVNITTDEFDYNLFTEAGSPGTAQTVTVNISSGVIINSTNTSTPAFDEGSGWAPGTTILINNLGTIWARGGVGGNGGNQIYGDAPVAGSNGAPGGNAIRLTVPTTINNGSGFIYGGGGGGGGGSGAYALGDDGTSGVLINSGGGGGGGGAGYIGAAGGTGGTATTLSDPYASGTDGISGGVAGGNGGSGGNVPFYWYFSRTLSGSNGGKGGGKGEDGLPAYAPTLTSYSSLDFQYTTLGLGGAAGKAVDVNGQSLTWLSGNDSTHVKGPVG